MRSASLSPFIELARHAFRRRGMDLGRAELTPPCGRQAARVLCLLLSAGAAAAHASEPVAPVATTPHRMFSIDWPFRAQDAPPERAQDKDNADANLNEDPDTSITLGPSAHDQPVWDYTLGSTFKSSDLTRFIRTASLEPVVGLRYGRWKLGIGDGTEWLRFNSFRKDSSLGYQWLDTRRFNLGLSLQLHTLTAGEGSDAPETGAQTVRGRAVANMAITRRWQAGLALTHDLLGKGDGNTLGFGVSYIWPLDAKSEMVLNAGLTWGTSEHWRNAYGPHRVGADRLQAGIDSWGAGLSYKHRLARHWAWFGSLSFTGDIGPLAQLPGNHKGRSGQIGLLYFHR